MASDTYLTINDLLDAIEELGNSPCMVLGTVKIPGEETTSFGFAELPEIVGWTSISNDTQEIRLFLFKSARSGRDGLIAPPANHEQFTGFVKSPGFVGSLDANGDWSQRHGQTKNIDLVQGLIDQLERRAIQQGDLVKLRVVANTAELEKAVLILSAVKEELKIIVDKGSIDEVFSTLIERQCIDRIDQVLSMFHKEATDEGDATEKRGAARKAAYMLAGTLNSVNKTVEEWKGVAIGTAATSTTIASGVTVLTNILK